MSRRPMKRRLQSWGPVSNRLVPIAITTMPTLPKPSQMRRRCLREAFALEFRDFGSIVRMHPTAIADRNARLTPNEVRHEATRG